MTQAAQVGLRGTFQQRDRDRSNDEHCKKGELEAGAEDFKAEPQGYEIITDPSRFEVVHKQIETKGLRPEVAEVTALPAIFVQLQGEQAISAVNRLIDALEDHDDVKEVYSNAEFPEEAGKVPS